MRKPSLTFRVDMNADDAVDGWQLLIRMQRRERRSYARLLLLRMRGNADRVSTHRQISGQRFGRRLILLIHVQVSLGFDDEHRRCEPGGGGGGGGWLGGGGRGSESL